MVASRSEGGSACAPAVAPPLPREDAAAADSEEEAAEEGGEVDEGGEEEEGGGEGVATLQERTMDSGALKDEAQRWPPPAQLWDRGVVSKLSSERQDTLSTPGAAAEKRKDPNR